jgi:hypothetical protein
MAKPTKMKPNTVAETLILPAAIDSENTVWEGRGTETLHNTFVR